MITTNLAGRHEWLLSHFVALGILTIMQDHFNEPMKFHWQLEQDEQPQLQVNGGYGLDDLAARVHEHAQLHVGPDAWIAGTQKFEKAAMPIFSPRTKPPGLKAWPIHEEARTAAIRTSRDGAGLSLLAGLGRPAWWRCLQNETLPDSGASRWEMKTRNRGEEFIMNRFLKLAEAVASRSVDEIASGLVGLTTVDECGNDKADSRSGTGLQPPGPVDNARAWCALWGLSALPVVHSDLSGISKTPGAWPRHRVHPDTAAIPLCTSPTQLERFTAIATSEAFDALVVRPHDGADSSEDINLAKARKWLLEQNVVYALRFSIRKTGSASAPERQVLRGEVLALAERA